MTGPVALRGGSSSIAVDPDALDALAARLTGLVGLVDRVGPLLRAGQPGASAAFDPVGYAELVAQSVSALALAAAATAGCLSLAATIRAAATGYRELDGVVARLRPLTRAAFTLPTALEDVRHRRFGRILVDDPDLAGAGVQLLTTTALTPALGPTGPVLAVVRPRATAQVSGLVGDLYPGRSSATTVRADAPTLAEPPRSVTDLLSDVALREGDDADGGAIDVRVLDGPNGRRVVVDIAGTTAWDLDPLHPSSQASNFGTNLQALANRPSAMSAGIRRALHRAGVASSTPIMLVGHSQGGLVAAELATEFSRDHEFSVTHVVTAGSPIGLSELPSSISLLSLENRGDPVPALDAADNPDRRTWLTATVAHGTADVLGKHSIDSYLSGATDFDADRDQAVEDWRSGAADFFDAHSSRTTVFTIGRN